MKIYKRQSKYDESPEFIFKLIPGYFAYVRFVYSFRLKRYIPHLNTMDSYWGRLECRKASNVNRETFCKWVGKTPEQVKGILLRRLQRKMAQKIQEAEIIKAQVEKDIRYMRLVRNRAKKADSSK